MSGSTKKAFKIPPHKEGKSFWFYIFWWGCMALALCWTGFVAFYWLSKPGGAIVTINSETLTSKPVSLPTPAVMQTKKPAVLPDTPKTPRKYIRTNDDEVHVVFSTDCTPFQDWQTLVVFHSAKTVGQIGPITRIASGCDEEKKLELTALYAKLYPEYHVHFTPDFKVDKETGKKFDFYNKPYGLHHWMTYSNPPVEDGTVIALIDPDMVFLRPLTAQLRGMPGLLHGKHMDSNDLPPKIGKGVPVAQEYGLGAPWANDHHKRFNRTAMCGVGSPCLLESESFASLHYAVGPPYMIEKSDALRIADSWTEIVPRVYALYPYLLAEMYAYSMGASHEKLPHYQIHNYMVSNIDSGGEGWPLVDVLPDTCVPPNGNGIYYPGKNLPTVMHYCQFYRAGELGFQKRRVPKDIFSCNSPMLAEPDAGLAFTDYRVKDGKKEPLSPLYVKRNAFALCILHRSINAAVLDYKQRMCDGNFNTAKTLNVQNLD